MSLPEFIMKLNQRFDADAQSFQRIFGVRLHQYWNIISGLDVIAFDTWINPPDGTSTYEAIRAKYGQEGVDVVKRLIGSVE